MRHILLSLCLLIFSTVPIAAQGVDSEVTAFTGDIVSYQGRQLTLRDENNQLQTVTLPSNTEVFVNSSPGTEADIMIGARATVTITDATSRLVILPLTTTSSEPAAIIPQPNSILIAIVVVLSFLFVTALLAWQTLAVRRQPDTATTVTTSTAAPPHATSSPHTNTDVPIPYT